MSRRTGTPTRRRASPSISSLSPAPRAALRSTSIRTEILRPRSLRHRRSGSKTGICCRNSLVSDRSCFMFQIDELAEVAEQLRAQGIDACHYFLYGPHACLEGLEIGDTFFPLWELI